VNRIQARALTSALFGGILAETLLTASARLSISSLVRARVAERPRQLSSQRTRRSFR
jgi:hypothetical protein